MMSLISLSITGKPLKFPIMKNLAPVIQKTGNNGTPSYEEKCHQERDSP